MKALLIFLASIITLQTFAADDSCALRSEHRVYVVADAHYQPDYIERKNLLIQGAIVGDVFLGMETDPGLLAKVLRPEVKDSIFAMEEGFAKGYALTHWAWRETDWLRLQVDLGLRREFTNSGLEEAVSSFHFYLLINPHMQAAWARARDREGLLASHVPYVKEVARALQASLDTKLDPEKAGLPIPLNDRDALAATSVVMKAVLRAYVEIAEALPKNQPDFYIPENIGRMRELLDFPNIVRSDKNYYIYFRWYYQLNMQFKQWFMLDWRSEQMAREVLRHICRMEKTVAKDRPYTAVIGGLHAVAMERFLKANGGGKLRVSIEAPPQMGSEFAELLRALKAKFN